MIISGIGYDSHRLIDGDYIILGGVKIQHNKGFLAHSDGDVLLHALIDALLSVAGLEDIGSLFPDTDPNYKGVSSLSLLSEVVNKTKGILNSINYVDTVIIAEQPKIRPYKDKIKANISKILNIPTSRLNIKAKTNEGLDAIGEEKAIAAYVIVTANRDIEE